MIDDGIRSNKNYRNFLVVIDKFNKYGWVIHLRSKTAQTVTNEFYFRVHKPNCEPSLTEPKDRKDFVSNVFTVFLIRQRYKKIS